MPNMGTKEAFDEAWERFNRGYYHGALEISGQLYAQQPGHPLVVTLHVAVLGKLQRIREAEMIARRALRHITNKAHRVGVITSLAETLTKEGELGDTENLIRDEIAKQPDVAVLHAKLGHVLQLKGMKDEVFELVERAKREGFMTLSIAGVYGRAALRTDRAEDALATIEEQFARTGDLDKKTEGIHGAYNALGHLYDKFGRYDEAMDAFKKSNEQIPAVYIDGQFERRVNMIREFWTAGVLASLERPAVPEGAATPVFIVGMPRSGTTLTEQIIDAHPEGYGAGELGLIGNLVSDLADVASDPYSMDPRSYDPEKVAAAAVSYRDATREMAGPDAKVITDKAPMNFWHMCFIAMLFPDAKIIHCFRDPRDNCLSCFFQSLAATHAYSVDLGNCGRFYRHYHAAAAYQTQALRDSGVGVGVFENRYEDTVDDQESKTRELLAFVGLGFHEKSMEFHKSGRVALTLSNDQVRQPIYKTSKRRFERYASHLSTLEDALGDLISDRVSEPAAGAATED